MGDGREVSGHRCRIDLEGFPVLARGAIAVLVIPAIDLKDGRCVRLRQGRMQEETVYSSEPAEAAARWEMAGAQWIHVVDLDGAVAGRRVNSKAVGEIRRQVRIPLQLGGGIRDLDAIEEWLSRGIDRVILGTVANENPGLVTEACHRYPGKIAVGIDARDGQVMVQGWRTETPQPAAALAREMASRNVAVIIFTDIERDGMGTGINVERTRELAQAIETPVIASGGVATLEDIKKVKALVPFGVIGVITGRALYDGTLDLSEAIRVAAEG